MADVAYPVVYAALLAAAEATVQGNDNVRAVDGYDLTMATNDVIQIGVPGLEDDVSITAGQFNQEQMTHGATGYIRETGSINGIAISYNGQSNANAARTAATGYVAALGAAIRADRKLGITDFDLVAQMGTGDIAEDKVDGATCAISFTVTYTALLGA